MTAWSGAACSDCSQQLGTSRAADQDSRDCTFCICGYSLDKRQLGKFSGAWHSHAYAMQQTRWVRKWYGVQDRLQATEQSDSAGMARVVVATCPEPQRVGPVCRLHMPGTACKQNMSPL